MPEEATRRNLNPGQRMRSVRGVTDGERDSFRGER